MPIQPKQQPPYYKEAINVKEYTAIISQILTNAPIPIILKNTIGNIIWTRQDVGEYRGTLTDAFLQNKTIAFIQPTVEYQPNITIYIGTISPNIISILTYDSGTLGDSILSASMTIKIYENV